MRLFYRKNVFRRIHTLDQIGLDKGKQGPYTLLTVDHFALRLKALEVCFLLAKKNDREEGKHGET